MIIDVSIKTLSFKMILTVRRQIQPKNGENTNPICFDEQLFKVDLPNERFFDITSAHKTSYQKTVKISFWRHFICIFLHIKLSVWRNCSTRELQNFVVPCIGIFFFKPLPKKYIRCFCIFDTYKQMCISKKCWLS